MFSPGNLLATNPVVLKRTLEQGGANLARGLRNAIEDFSRELAGAPPPASADYAVGRNLAITPGKVVMRNRLVELIQYAPTTAQVRAEPILIRSEEHTSELQSLMRISYAVFCLKTKKHKN